MDEKGMNKEEKRKGISLQEKEEVDCVDSFIEASSRVSNFLIETGAIFESTGEEF